MFKAQYAPYVLVATVLMTLQPVLTTLSKDNGKYAYLYVSATMLAELTKLFVSLALLWHGGNLGQFATVSNRNVLTYAIPALIYFINNNLIFAVLTFVDSATFQILSCLKTVFTGILFRVFLGRQLSEVQAVAILMLACGTAVCQIPVCEDAAAMATSRHNSLWGVTLQVVSCIFSAFAGIYSEFLMKKDVAHSIHLQNALLYGWGVLFNLVGLGGKDMERIAAYGLLHGYSWRTWLVVLNNAFNGLAISAILKYTDNIVRVYAHAAAMLLTMALGVLLFSTPMSAQLVLSMIIVSSSTYLYNIKAPSAVQPSAKTNGDSTGLPKK